MIAVVIHLVCIRHFSEISDRPIVHSFANSIFYRMPIFGFSFLVPAHQSGRGNSEATGGSPSRSLLDARSLIAKLDHRKRLDDLLRSRAQVHIEYRRAKRGAQAVRG